MDKRGLALARRAKQVEDNIRREKERKEQKPPPTQAHELINRPAK